MISVRASPEGYFNRGGKTSPMHDVHVSAGHMPALGLGTWELRGRACRKAVQHALEIGYRHIDTATVYENEHEVGAGMRASGVDRDEVFLTTKVWIDHLAQDAVVAHAEESLRRLETEYVDLLLIHWPIRGVPLEETFAGFRVLVDAGKVRHVGVSNFPSPLLRSACAIAPVLCNQIEFHPYLSQRRVLAAARELGVIVAAYCPLGQGRVAKDRALRSIGRPHGKSAAQVAIRWLIQQDGVVALPRSSKSRRRVENQNVFDFSLSDAEMGSVSALARGDRLIDPHFGPAWDED